MLIDLIKKKYRKAVFLKKCVPRFRKWKWKFCTKMYQLPSKPLLRAGELCCSYLKHGWGSKLLLHYSAHCLHTVFQLSTKTEALLKKNRKSIWVQYCTCSKKKKKQNCRAKNSALWTVLFMIDMQALIWRVMDAH